MKHFDTGNLHSHPALAWFCCSPAPFYCKHAARCCSALLGARGTFPPLTAPAEEHSSCPSFSDAHGHVPPSTEISHVQSHISATRSPRGVGYFGSEGDTLIFLPKLKAAACHPWQVLQRRTKPSGWGCNGAGNAAQKLFVPVE